NTPTVSAFSIDPSTHGFTPLAGQPTPVAGVGRDIAVDPSGKFVYITFLEPDGVTWAVAGRSRDATSGLLTPMPNSPFVLSGQDSRRIVVTPGNLVLVANFATSNISVLTLDPATGTLTPAPGSPVGTGVGPISLAVDPSGKFVFVANQGSNNVSVFSISGSTLTPVAGSPFFGGTNTGASPTAITVDPSGKFVYVTNGAGTAAAGSISAFSLNSSTGALTLVPSSPFLGGNGPQSAVVVTP
ncbi:MAG TPA: beta-propeller fold lactonase family protein, partial [Terriglobales bacterium]|nr:beta-propeller fold lactonase family protein [Terriglobales bacterium]